MELNHDGELEREVHIGERKNDGIMIYYHTLMAFIYTTIGFLIGFYFF